VSAAFRVKALGPDHTRTEFSCGDESLDSYFAKQAGEDMRRRVSACFVVVELSSSMVAGYYTLAAGGVPFNDLPLDLWKRLPRYPSVSVARIGRLAVHQRFQGRKLGGALLADAAVRAARSEMAFVALLVDAQDDSAASFYRHHGFQLHGTSTRHLFIPVQRFRSVHGETAAGGKLTT